jgi:hypothetical protein
MKSAIGLVALFGFLLNIGLAQVKPTPLQPSRMEAFAGAPTAQITWSKEVGQIESDEARVTITALMIRGAVHTPQRMCGIRLDLANQKASDQVYLEAAKLEAVRRALEEIQSGIGTFRKEPAGSPYRYLGAAEFWHPHLKVHTLNAAYYIAPESSGLSLSAYKDQGFRFPDHRPSELAELIGMAMNELQRYCRRD